MDLKLFLSTYTLIFLAELPDKTAFATLLMATKGNPRAIFIGSCLAFVVQSFVAVCFGSALAMLPEKWVHLAAGILFIIFSVLMFGRSGETDEANEATLPDSFWSGVKSSFLVIFIAEWGDLTQLATASLQAKYNSPITIFISSTLALWSVTASAVFLGSRLRTFLNPQILNKIAAVAFAAIGGYFIFNAIKSF